MSVSYKFDYKKVNQIVHAHMCAPLIESFVTVISPHVGGLTNTVQKNSVDQCIRNIVAVMEGDPMPEEVIFRDD